MSAGVITLSLQGRMGNCLFSYAFARAFAERHGLQLQTEPWVGQKIFELDDPPIENPDLPTLSENDELPVAGGFRYRSYSQQQKCLIYTRKQVRQWFTLRGWVRGKLSAAFDPDFDTVLAHRRVGDLIGYSYPVVSRASYFNARLQHGLLDHRLEFATEEHPRLHHAFASDLACVPDFVRLMDAPVLLRGNSTFSFWAATLGNGQVFSPVIDGLEGGREHDVKFVPGNHKKFCNLDFVTDLHLKEK